jgi:hypothetical protein
MSYSVGDDYSFSCNADGETIWAVAYSSKEQLVICDAVFRLLAASAVHSVELSHWVMYLSMLPAWRF